MSGFPDQPIVIVNGVSRFRPNNIVQFLLNTSKFNLNDLAFMPFGDEDRAQFAQLIGYSVSGYQSLSYVQRLENVDGGLK